MKLAVVTNDPNCFQIQNLKQAAERNKIKLDLLALEKLVISPESDELLQKLLAYDLIYYRNEKTPILRNIVAEFCLSHNKVFINSGYKTMPLAGNKIKQLASVADLGGIKFPTSVVIDRNNYNKQTQSLFSYLKQQIGLPFITKPSMGKQGKDVLKIETLDQLKKAINQEKNNRLVFQEYIPNHGDYRIFVLGGKTLGIMNRLPPEDDFRANISQGGKGIRVKNQQLINSLSRAGERIAQHFSLEIVGVDIMQSTDTQELYFIETNSMPEWKGLSTTLDKDIGEAIINYFIKLINEQ